MRAHSGENAILMKFMEDDVWMIGSGDEQRTIFAIRGDTKVMQGLAMGRDVGVIADALAKSRID